MKRIKFFTKEELVHENKRAIREKRNMTISPERMADLPFDVRIPVLNAILHNDCEMRCKLVLNAEGETVWLDVSLGIFNRLREAEVED